MPTNRMRTHTFSVRTPKDDMRLLRELARKLGTTPSKLFADALRNRLPSLIKKAAKAASEIRETGDAA